MRASESATRAIRSFVREVLALVLLSGLALAAPAQGGGGGGLAVEGAGELARKSSNPLGGLH